MNRTVGHARTSAPPYPRPFKTVTAMIRKRSITLHGHRTSFSVEDAFLDELKTIARKRGLSFAALIAEIDESRPLDSNLSSALRLFVLRELKQVAREAEGKILESSAEANVERSPVS